MFIKIYFFQIIVIFYEANKKIYLCLNITQQCQLDSIDTICHRAITIIFSFYCIHNTSISILYVRVSVLCFICICVNRALSLFSLYFVCAWNIEKRERDRLIYNSAERKSLVHHMNEQTEEQSANICQWKDSKCE